MVRFLGRSRAGPAARTARSGRSPSERGRTTSLLGIRSVAGQVFVLQAVVVLLLVLAGTAVLTLQAKQSSTAQARDRAMAVARTFALSPGMAHALSGPDPAAVLQPRAEAAMKQTGVDFVVVLNAKGVRYTNPDPGKIGTPFIGDLGPVLAGGSIVDKVDSFMGPVDRAVVPIRAADGSVIGAVSAGQRSQTVNDAFRQELPLLFGGAALGLVLATGGTALVGKRLRRQTHGLDPAEIARMYEHHDAVLHAVREGVLILDGDQRLVLANDEARRLLDLPSDVEGRRIADLGLEPHALKVLAGDRTASDEVFLSGGRLVAVNVRSTLRQGGPPGSVATLRDTTELRALSGKADMAGERLRLLYDASLEIGSTLDVTRTASELARVAVPRLADFVTVDLADAVLLGDEPDAVGSPSWLRRTAVHGIRRDHPLYPAGRLIAYAPATPQAGVYAGGRAAITTDLRHAEGLREQDPEHFRSVVEYGIHSLMTVPLAARNALLGVVSFWRSQRPEPFDDDDLSLAVELGTRAALAVDNARRYTREHTMAVALQHSLLPHDLPEQSALDVASRYLPAQAGVGGDWFDVLPLPGARVALVVGDVVGHGLHAAVTMGRLRTAVHNFSALDMPPDELLWHLDELVTRIDQTDATTADHVPLTGATCLYAIYDPVDRRCTVARAGHMPPAVVRPDGSVEFPELPAGPPLGLSGLPFEAAELLLPEDSRLVLYTNGLIADRERDADTGLGVLRTVLARSAGLSPEDTCQAIVDSVPPPHPADDIALLVARTRGLPSEQVREWDVPFDPAAVARVRAAVARQLALWHVAEEAFTTELILTELVTNSIRHATGPIRVRLLRGDSLVCEVADASSTAPHLRYAAYTDEGGRGLFLVAQLAQRWGTRYTANGKIVWAEQPLPR